MNQDEIQTMRKGAALLFDLSGMVTFDAEWTKVQTALVLAFDKANTDSFSIPMFISLAESFRCNETEWLEWLRKEPPAQIPYRLLKRPSPTPQPLARPVTIVSSWQGR